MFLYGVAKTKTGFSVVEYEYWTMEALAKDMIALRTRGCWWMFLSINKLEQPNTFLKFIEGLKEVKR